MQRLRNSGYLIFGLATVFPIIDFLTSIAPAHWGTASWRFGSLGLLTNYAMGTTVELFFLIVIARLWSHRRALLVLGAIAALSSLFLCVGSISFAMDALQTRTRMDPTGLHKFDVTALLAQVKLVLFAIAMGYLSFGAYSAGVRKEKGSGSQSGLLVRQSKGDRIVSVESTLPASNL